MGVGEVTDQSVGQRGREDGKDGRCRSRALRVVTARRHETATNAGAVIVLRRVVRSTGRGRIGRRLCRGRSHVGL